MVIERWLTMSGGLWSGGNPISSTNTYPNQSECGSAICLPFLRIELKGMLLVLPFRFIAFLGDCVSRQFYCGMCRGLPFRLHLVRRACCVVSFQWLWFHFECIVCFRSEVSVYFCCFRCIADIYICIYIFTYMHISNGAIDQPVGKAPLEIVAS